jgi:host factor-I protein
MVGHASGGFRRQAGFEVLKATRDRFADTKKGTSAMAPERAQNLQDTFLNHVRKNKTPLTIFLVNGVKLQGVVTWFDNFCVLLRRDGHSQLVYKHAISTVMPGQPIQLFEPADDAPSVAVDKV